MAPSISHDATGHARWSQRTGDANSYRPAMTTAPDSFAPHRIEPSHVGLCVSDLEASLRFYCDGLGFAIAESYALDDTAVPGLANALEVTSPVIVQSQMITKGGLKIELLAYTSPPATGTPSQSRGHRGLTHLTFVVADVDSVAAHLVECGGTILASTDVSVGVRLLFLADPDGTRVELMAY